jgi:2-keto-4-pentenoate hydratase
VASDAELIAEFIGARTEHRAHTPPSERQGQPLSLAEAYRLQDVLRDALVRRGETVTGWKAGFTNRGAQDAYQVSEPVCAFLLASSVLPSGAEVPVARFTGLAVEAEVAFVMGRDLAGPGVTASAAADAVKGAQPALELVDFGTPARLWGPTSSPRVFAKSVVLAEALTPIAGLDLALEVWCGSRAAGSGDQHRGRGDG